MKFNISILLIASKIKSNINQFHFPLPLEAALAKNKVIGYVGGGGQEYWKKPIVSNKDKENFSFKKIKSLIKRKK